MEARSLLTSGAEESSVPDSESEEVRSLGAEGGQEAELLGEVNEAYFACLITLEKTGVAAHKLAK